jgi:cell division protein FtsZ
MTNLILNATTIVSDRQPQTLTKLMVKEHPATPVPLNAGKSPAEFSDLPDIRVIGLGVFGSTIATILSRNLPGVTCYEVIHDASGESSMGFDGIMLAVTSADLVFVVTDPDDQHCDIISQTVGIATIGAGVPTVAVTSSNTGRVPVRSYDGKKWCDTLFSVSARSLPDHGDISILTPDSLTGYSIRQVISVVTSLITHRTGICIDYADIKTIMRNGNVGRFGVGIGTGTTKARDAAEGALQRLERQGVKMANAKGILTAVHGSSLLTMGDFDAASGAIHDQASADADLLCGLIVDEAMGANVKVSILTVQ